MQQRRKSKAGKRVSPGPIKQAPQKQDNQNVNTSPQVTVSQAQSMESPGVLTQKHTVEIENPDILAQRPATSAKAYNTDEQPLTPAEESIVSPDKAYSVDTITNNTENAVLEPEDSYSSEKESYKPAISIQQEVIAKEKREQPDSTVESIGFPSKTRTSPIPPPSPPVLFTAERNVTPPHHSIMSNSKVLYLPVSNHARAYHETLHYYNEYNNLVCGKIQNDLLKSLQLQPSDPAPRRSLTPGNAPGYENTLSIIKMRKALLERRLAEIEARSVLHWTPKQVAAQLSVLDIEIMGWVQEADLNARPWTKGAGSPVDPIQKRKAHPGLYAHFDFFNHVTRVIERSLQDPAMTQKHASHWVKVALYLWKMNSFDMLACAVSSIVAANGEKALKQKEKETLIRLGLLTSEENNYKRFRKLHAKASKKIPFLGIFIHDLTMLSSEDPGESQLSDKKIHDLASDVISWVRHPPSIVEEPVDEDFRYWILGGGKKIKSDSAPKAELVTAVHADAVRQEDLENDHLGSVGDKKQREPDNDYSETQSAQIVEETSHKEALVSDLVEKEQPDADQLGSENVHIFDENKMYKDPKLDNNKLVKEKEAEPTKRHDIPPNFPNKVQSEEQPQSPGKDSRFSPKKSPLSKEPAVFEETRSPSTEILAMAQDHASPDLQGSVPPTSISRPKGRDSATKLTE